MIKVRHILGISGGKDSAALAIYLKKTYPLLKIEYYNSDTGCELAETEALINRLEAYLGKIERLRAAEDSPEPTPFHHFLKAMGGFLPSPQARWCTKKMKLDKFEEYVGSDYAVSYVGIRGDEDRDGYISSKPNIQAVFPFRKNIWSIDVINKFLHHENLDQIVDIYERLCPKGFLRDEILEIVKRPVAKQFYYSKKMNTLLDYDVKLFNHAVFEFLKTTDYPVGKLDKFPLLDNTDVLVKEDIFRLLKESGVGIPAYYEEIPFEVDGEKGTYCRSRSGCYFCFFQQKIEWVWLYEQHPDLFKKAMEFEKDGYTWNQNESLADLIKPERIRQIKLDIIKRQKENCANHKGTTLVDILGDDIMCTNCFI
ncbi:phosphoadenosine phosphosulfate reductase [Alloprevotella tannerae]|uniref:phosphoadenosine phosphosulfate reductase n=1 Tax=Alloprevotella tannerae TaxID=76122 RepID=UPI0028ED6E23|nr:phosphoadenosine phosphosulfate reductase [Alloprevotella tannerae]